MNYIDFYKLFQVQYILSSEVSYHFKFLIPLLVIFGVILLASTVLWYFLRQREIIFKKLADQILTFGLITGILGYLLIFFRIESLPFLSLRILLIILILAMIVWLAKIALWAIIAIPKWQKQNQERKNFEKYLPRAKKIKKNIN